MGRAPAARRVAALAAAAVATVLTAIPTVAAETTTSQADGNWNDIGWSAGTPEAGDTAVINHNVLLTNSPPGLAELIVSSSKTLTFAGWTNTIMTATVVTISGTLTHTNQSATTTNISGGWDPDARIYIVCSNLTVATGGKIDVDGKGYRGGVKAGYLVACGPGAGGNGTGGGQPYNAGGGGGYGGFGGPPTGAESRSGKTYGSTAAPVDPGSGGGTGDGNGGGGGGAVWIDALDAVTIDGSITANGLATPGSHGGGGSGGGVYIGCKTIAGGGTVSANGGGTLSTGSSGGGGRIAVLYNPSAQSSVPGITFSAGAGTYATYTEHLGDIGTLYFPDSRFLTEVIRHQGQWLTASAFTSWAPERLTVSNAWFRFPLDGFQLTTTNGLAVMGTDKFMHRLELTNGSIACGSDLFITNASLRLYRGATLGPSLTCGGNLTDAGGLYVYSGLSNWVAPGYGALVGVTGDLRVASGGSIYPYSHVTNGSSVFFTCNNLLIDTGGAVTTDGLGYRGALKSIATACGPGAGTNGTGGSSAGAGGGGGYGGSGGGFSSMGGPVCGTASAPTEPGSGGGTGDSNGGNGGGAVRVVATEQAVVNGSISANGTGMGGHGGSGSGGSIYISCRQFAGTNGVLEAKGGTPSASDGGGGGGGRISIVYSPSFQSNQPVPQVRFTTTGGKGGTTGWLCGDVGTLYFPDNQWLTDTIPHSGQWSVPGVSSWATNRLIVTNAWFRFPTSGFQLSVQNEISVLGNDTITCRLEFTNATVTCGGNLLVTNASVFLYRSDTSGSSLNCGGNITLTNLARMYVYGGLTSGVAPDYGSLVSAVGDVTVASNCWIFPYSHPTNGGSVLFCMRHLTVQGSVNGGFNADGSGFAGAASKGAPVYGPGKGGNGTGGGPVANSGGGGGFGGMGGGVSSRGGQTYGSSNAPVEAGSGGESGDGGGGSGGGAVRIVASGTVTLKGIIRAMGYDGPSGHSGGGSGGGIYIHCRKFIGDNNGYLKANGGAGSSAGGGGGGGRIAVWRVFDVSGNLVSNSVDGGASPGGYTGFPGTIVWGQLLPGGTVFVVH